MSALALSVSYFNFQIANRAAYRADLPLKFSNGLIGRYYFDYFTYETGDPIDPTFLQYIDGPFGMLSAYFPIVLSNPSSLDVSVTECYLVTDYQPISGNSMKMQAIVSECMIEDEDGKVQVNPLPFSIKADSSVVLLIHLPLADTRDKQEISELDSLSMHDKVMFFCKKAGIENFAGPVYDLDICFPDSKDTKVSIVTSRGIEVKSDPIFYYAPYFGSISGPKENVDGLCWDEDQRAYRLHCSPIQ